MVWLGARRQLDLPAATETRSGVIVAGAALTAALSVLACVISGRLTTDVLRLPWGAGERPSGDAALMYALAATMRRHGWFSFNPDLGFPFGMDFAHVPFAEIHQWATLWAVTRFVHDPIMALNVFFLVGYAAVGASGYLLFRATAGVGWLAVALGVAGASLPWHLTRFHHTLLADYSPVPVFLLLAYLMWEGWWQQRPRRVVVALLASGYVGTSGAYYAAFGLLMLVPVLSALAWSKRRLNAILVDVLVAAAIPGSLVVAAVAHAALRRTGAEGPALRARTPGMSLVFAGDPSTLLIPWPVQDSRIEGSGLFSLFVAASFGAAIVLLVVVAASARRDRHVGALDGALLPWFRLLAWTLLWFLPGLGWVFATVVNPQIRSWGRLSLVVAYISLVIVGTALARALDPRPLWGRGAQVGLILLLAAGIAIDQRALLVSRTAASFDADARLFAAAVAEVVPLGCPVLVLPQRSYPEGQANSQVGPYDQLWVGVYDPTHRFSAGVVGGTDGARGYAERYRGAGEPGALATVLDHAREDAFCAVLTDALDDGGPLSADLAGLLGPPAVQVGRWAVTMLTP